jgi:uncharacterized protein with NRDE domain
MCLLVVAWLSHPRYRLVLAGNRDEFHDRPAAALGWWPEAPGILAGRDLKAGGTWLGLARSGRFALVTNFRDPDDAPPAGSPSRGQLVQSFLAHGSDPARYLDELSPVAARYAGFNLLVGDRADLHYYSNAVSADPRRLAPGVYGLSNHRLDEPWPKLVRTRERFAAMLANDDPAPAALFDVLADQTPMPTAVPAVAGLPAGLERALSAPFVRHEHYGTRCSTIVLVEHGGRTVVHERRFDPSGAQTGVTRIAFAEPAG